MQYAHRPFCSAATMVVPDPANVSSTVALLRAVLDQVVKEGDRLHRWVFLVLARALKLQDGCLFPVAVPRMGTALAPAVQARLVLPLVILSPEYKPVFGPD